MSYHSIITIWKKVLRSNTGDIATLNRTLYKWYNTTNGGFQMQDRVFVNFTNHPSEKWELKQKDAAEEYGRIIDVPFPMVSPSLDEKGIEELSAEYVNKIMNLRPTAVLCQGEFNLCFSVITELKAKGITVLAACSRRMVEENENIKSVKFEFERFRRY